VDSPLPLRMRGASNPYGPGVEWCYRRFILEGGVADRVFISAKLEDNPHLDMAAYELSLKELGPVAYRQLRFGDWTVRPEGGLFRSEWFADRLIDRGALPGALRLCRYWDLAATEAGRGADPDYTCGALLGRTKEGTWYVIDVVRTRSSPLDVERLVARTAQADRVWATGGRTDPLAIRMEQEPGSAGVNVIDRYRREILVAFDFRGVRSSGSKEVRAAPVAARAEAGDLWVCRGSWNTAFLDELAAFPSGSHDDQVDALAGAYAHLAQTRAVPIVAPAFDEGPSYWRMGWPGEDW
jgi:predicted phage terminase large subunit-like protein